MANDETPPAASASGASVIPVSDEVRALVQSVSPSPAIEKEIIDALTRHGLVTSSLIGNLSSAFFDKASEGLSVAAGACFSGIAEDVAAFVKKRRKVAVDSQFKQGGSSADVSQLIAAVAASYKTVLPPSALHGISNEIVAQIANKENGHYLSFKSLVPKDSSLDLADEKLFNFSVSKAEKGENPFSSSSKGKRIGSISELAHSGLRYALLVAAIVDPEVLSALDVVSYLLRLLSLSGSLSVDELVLYDDKYRRSIASLVAASTDLSVSKCFVNDAYPTLLAEFSFNRSRSVPSKPGNNSDRQKSRQVCYAFQKEGRCRFGSHCRFRHAGAPGKDEVQPARSEYRGSKGSSGAPPKAQEKDERSGADACIEDGPAREHVAQLRKAGHAAVGKQLTDTGFQDGTGLSAKKPSDFAATCCAPELPVVASILFEEASAIATLEWFRGLKGAPSGSQAKALETTFSSAAASAVARLCKVLDCSDRSASCGSPIRAPLGSALAKVTNDPDVHLFSEVDVGLNLGVDPPIHPTGTFPPAKSKKDLDKAMEVFNLKRTYQNFASVELRPEICKVILDREVALGRMRRLSAAQASQASHRLYARMALIPKSSGEYRLIEDHSGSGLNAQCSLSETCSLPRSCDIRSGLADLFAGSRAPSVCHCRSVFPRKRLDSYDYLFLKYDIASAYRHLFVREVDRPRVSVRLGQDVYESLALPFGAGTSPFHWCRASASLCRIVAACLRCTFGHEKFLSLIYVDDGLLAFPEALYAVGSAMTLLIWRCLNFELNWEKSLFSVRSVKFIGFEAVISHTGEASVRVHPDIFRSIRDILLAFVDEGRVTPAPLSKVIGKLVFACQGMRHLKGFLQPLYALLSIFEKKKLRSMKLSKSSASFGSVLFWLGVAEKPAPCSLLNPAFVGPASLIAASDASTDFMAGWVSCGSGGLWFQLEATSVTLGRWASHLAGAPKRPVPTHRDIALLELLAATITLHLAASLTSSVGTSQGLSADVGYVVLFCDNLGVVGLLKKLYSPKPALAAVLRGIASWFGFFNDRLVLSHLPSEENWLADGISRGDCESVPKAWRRVPIALDDIFVEQS
ncbi:hypothetical protein FOL47_000903 [Perkinsus chesapeaki]|uniref:C3H1-type domain-containing protein n=1 Tax=Perkinsus chesapeaki TaxID=330153 RepID=A0A7J6KVT9_PERCH|nr:hypothetical protein FOL47_000903 [Perkinsus chesapeaki]